MLIHSSIEKIRISESEPTFEFLFGKAGYIQHTFNTEISNARVKRISGRLTTFSIIR